MAVAKLAETQREYRSDEVASTMFQNSPNISTESYGLPTTAASKQTYFGLGMGLDYGGLIGAKLEHLPVKHLGLFAGLGYNTLSVGWNIGVTCKTAPDKTVSFNPMIFYGYNAFIKVENASEYSKTSYGITIGANLDIIVGGAGNKISLGLFVPIRSQEFKDHYDALKKDPRFELKNELPPVGISVGFNF